MANNVNNKTVFFDGAKSILLEQYPDDAWDWLSGRPTNEVEADYFKFIPTLFRAVQLRSQAVSSMPFQIVKGNGEEPFDSSDDWQNKVGFLPNPFVLLQLVEAALCLSGRAYLFKVRSQAMPKELRYILPASVTPKIDAERGLTGFKRRVNSQEKDVSLDDIIYFFWPDPYVEIGPAINYPARAAVNACGVLLNVDLFASQFFKRGAIKAMLLTVKGIPLESERQKLESWWKNVVAGIKNAFGAKVVNAEAVTPVVVGEGLKELENTSLTREKQEDIAKALGIPLSILFADAANYATSQQDELNYLTKTVVPECDFIQSVLNEQLFTRLGYRFEFLPDTLDAFQEDETARAQSLKTLTDAGFPLLMACDILGYELSEQQRAELEAAEEEKKRKAEEMAESLAKQPQLPPGSQNGNGNNREDERGQELRAWRRKVAGKMKAGKAAAEVKFECDHVPASLAGAIAGALEAASTMDEVDRIFDNAMAWKGYP